MSTLTPSALLDWLARHQFLDAAQVAELQPLLPTFADVPTLVRELVRRDWLTPYQANQVVQGKEAQLVLGCYRLRERIGEGAMGQVFKAWNTRLHRVVALKTLHKELVASAKAMDRFRREMETAAQLDHPHIVLVRDADEADGRPFLVMDYIVGTTLAQLVKQHGPLPVAEAADYARQAALGLQHAFERGIVHRDVKPGNLIRTGQPPLVKILDFGLARFDSERNLSSPRLTQFGHLLGTVDYISPEQAENAQQADVRADIYSLGCTLYYLLTGKPPFPGDDLVAKVSARLLGDPPSVRDVRPDVPPGLDAVMRTMMARQPDERYQAPAEVAAALLPFTGREPPTEAVPLAAPVAVAAENVPLAAPVYAAPVEPAIAEPPAEFAPDSAPGWSPPAESTAAPRPPAPPKKGLPVGLLVGGGLAVLVLVGFVGWAVVGGLLTRAPAKKGYWNPNAALRITKVKLSNDVIRPGDRKRVLVYIDRAEFQGPVKVHVENLPDGVQTGTTVIPANAKSGDVSLTVSYGTDPVETEIKVVAVAENLRDEKPLPLTVIPDKR